MNQLIQNVCSIVIMNGNKKDEFLSTLKNTQQCEINSLTKNNEKRRN